MRDQIIDLTRKAGIKVSVEVLSEADLYEADEVFFSNTLQGVQSAGAYKQKRYFNKFAAEVRSHLNGLVSDIVS